MDDESVSESDPKLEGVEQISIDVMEALARHNPNVLTAIRIVTEILAGALLQIAPGPNRDIMRQALHKIIDADEHETVAVDLSPLINRHSNH